MVNAPRVCYALALIVFILAAFGVNPFGVVMLALGLAFLALAPLVG